MKINKDITSLILTYANRYFSNEKSFYRLNGVKMTDANWQRFKNGTTAIEKMPAERINNMLEYLFTPFEISLISQAQIYYYLSNKYKFTISFDSFYDMFKKNVLMSWLNQNDALVTGKMERLIDANGNYTATILTIEYNNHMFNFDEFTINLSNLRFKCYGSGSDKVPAGRENRLKWIKDNLENIR